MWDLIKDFWTDSAVARKAMRFCAVIATGMLVPPFPQNAETWAIRFGVALAAALAVTRGPKDKPKADDPADN